MIKNAYGEHWQFGDKLKIANDYRGEMIGNVVFIEYCNTDTDLCLVRDDRGQNYSFRRANLEFVSDGFNGGVTREFSFDGSSRNKGTISTITQKAMEATADKNVKQEQQTKVNPEKDLAKHYKYSYKGIKIDPYRILKLYGITDPAQQHAIKKLLRAGNSVKNLEQDITEVIMTLQRMLEIIKEDGETIFVKKEDKE